MTKKALAIKFALSFATGDVAFVQGALDPNYIQHNLEFGTGAHIILGAIKRLHEQAHKPTVKIFRALEDGDYVVLHAQFNFGEGERVVLHVFRFANGKIVEHWDNTAPLGGVSPSGHTQLDGEVAISDLAKTSVNKKLVLAAQEAYRAHDFVAGTKYLHPDYVQHNLTFGDGIAGAKKAMADAAKQGATVEFGKIHHVLGEGNFVLVTSEAQRGKARLAVFDLFRVADNLIVEHWDVIAPIIDESHPRWANNPNGKW